MRIGEMFGISGIEGGRDSVICNGYRPIFGLRRGLIRHVHQSHSQPFGVSNGLASRHSLCCVSPPSNSSAQCGSFVLSVCRMTENQSRLPFTSKCRLVSLGMLVSFLDRFL